MRGGLVKKVNRHVSLSLSTSHCVLSLPQPPPPPHLEVVSSKVRINEYSFFLLANETEDTAKVCGGRSRVMPSFSRERCVRLGAGARRSSISSPYSATPVLVSQPPQPSPLPPPLEPVPTPTPSQV